MQKHLRLVTIILAEALAVAQAFAVLQHECDRLGSCKASRCGQAAPEVRPPSQVLIQETSGLLSEMKRKRKVCTLQPSSADCSQ